MRKLARLLRVKWWLIMVSILTGGFYSLQGQITNGDIHFAAAGAKFAVSAPGAVANVGGAALANDDYYLVVKDTKLKIKPRGVLANDLGGAKPLTAQLIAKPAHGKLSFSKKGGFSYTPSKGYTGMDSFTYVATDKQTTSGAATVRLLVTSGLLASNDFYSTELGTPLSVPAPGVLSNEFAYNFGAKAILVSGPQHGDLSWGGDGSFTYTPTNGFTGIDGFTYRDSIGSLNSGVASVDVMVLGPGELFHDNFNRPTSNGIFPWTRVSGTFPAGTHGVSDVGGTWGITNGLMIGTGTNYTYGYTYCGDTNWTDYSVEGQVQFSRDSAASAGLVGRLNPVTGAHYAVWIYPENSDELNVPSVGDGIPRLWLYKYSTWTTYTSIGQSSPLPNIGTNWHSLKLTFQGNSIASYFDGNLVTNVTDDGSIDGTPAYSGGSLGLNLWISTTPYLFSVSNVIATVLADAPAKSANVLPAKFSGTNGFTNQSGDSNNSPGKPTSNVAITPVAAPVLLSIGLTNQIITLTWNSVTGASYELQTTTNLMSGHWSSVSSNLTASGSTTSQTQAASDAPLQFYRIVLSSQP